MYGSSHHQNQNDLCDNVHTSGYVPIFVNPTAPLLQENDNYQNSNQNDIDLIQFNVNQDLDLKLKISGAGNMQNTKQVMTCNTLIVNCLISGAGNIKVIQQALPQRMLVNQNKGAKTVQYSISGMGSISKFDNNQDMYDEIQLNANISGAGNINFHVICNEIQWYKTKITGVGQISHNNQVIRSQQNNNSRNNNNVSFGDITMTQDNPFYFYTKDGDLSFTRLGFAFGVILGGLYGGVTVAFLVAKLRKSSNN